MRGGLITSVVFYEFFAEKIISLSWSKSALRYWASWQSRNVHQILLAGVAVYTEELERLNSAPSRRLVEGVEGLLAGGSNVYLDYPVDACHVGAIALGARAELECRALAERLGCELLALPREEKVVWAWFGSHRQIDLAQLERLAERGGTLSLAVGEPRDGLDGWRLTHQERRPRCPGHDWNLPG
jgi:hypothetical protein